MRAAQVLCCSERTPGVVLAIPAVDVPQLVHSFASSLSCSVHIQLVWSFKKQTVTFNLVSRLLISRITYERVPDYGVLGSRIKSSRYSSVKQTTYGFCLDSSLSKYFFIPNSRQPQSDCLCLRGNIVARHQLRICVGSRCSV